MKIEFPTTVDAAIGSLGTYRAGGVDVQDLLQIRAEPDLITDISRISELRGISDGADGSTKIGAATTIAETVTHLHKRYPALGATGCEVATPQLRNVATLAGNLAQSTRCWYFRNSLSACFKTGGDSCPASVGDNLYGVVINQGPCVFPHPSSIGMALLVYDAEIEINGSRRLPVGELWGDGSDPRHDNILKPGELITAIHLPQPWPSETGGYVRSISRFASEWPLVESVCRVVVDRDVVQRAAIAVGGVANTPLRLPEVEAALSGAAADKTAAHRAATLVIERTAPFAETRYKVPIMVATITDALIAAFRSAGCRSID